MIRIMFVCHENICRSPMAEFIFKDMLKKCGREIEIIVLQVLRVRRKYGTKSAFLSIHRQKRNLQR